MKDLNLYEKHRPSENNYPIKFFVYNSKNGFHAHWHEHIELQYYATVSTDLTCGSQHIDIQAKDLIVINREQIHYASNGMGCKFYCLILSPTLLNDLEFPEITFENIVRNDSTVIKYMEDIIQEANSQQEGWHMALKGLVYGLLTHLVRNYKKESPGSNASRSATTNKQRMWEILDYIKAHYSDNLSTKDLSDSFYMSEHYFCRYFKKNMGQSTIDYINRYRIEKAIDLLAEEDMSISDISETVGFNNQNYFSRVFKQVTGLSPQEYRNRLRT